MKIMHSSGEEYDLTPGVTLEIERTNPFFNSYGERSLPVTLPPTEANRRLMAYPDDIAGVSKMSQRADAMLQHGAYFMRCRQAILSANQKHGIDTSFYLNTGAFNEKVQDISLSEIFENKVISFSSVNAAISFCQNLYVSYDERFACFPVKIDGMTLNGFYIRGTMMTSTPVLNGTYQTTMDEGGKTISLDPGYYITPFVRGVHLLREVFTHFGYRLLDNFFTTTEPFRSMVFLNNTIDTIMKSEIRYSQILPDCKVSTLLNFYRNMFCCEFIPDEVNRTIDIRFFDDVLSEETTTDISHLLADKYTVEHPPKFKQVKLTAEYVNAVRREQTKNRSGDVLTEANTETFNTFKTVRELLNKFPDVEYDPITGEFYRLGFRGTEPVEQTVGFLSCDYYAGGDLEPFEVKIECKIPTGSVYRGNFRFLQPYIGEGRALNSTVVMDTENTPSENTEETEVNAVDGDDLPIIPCFVGRHASGYADFGTIMNYNEAGTRLWNYTLAFNGPDGLFERFWRKRDDLLRNSLLKVKAPLLLSDTDKLQLSEYKKVILNGQELFPDVIKFAVDRIEIQESTFYTTKLYEPISSALPDANRIPTPSLYRWKLEYSLSDPRPLPGNGRRLWIFKEEPTILFYSPPTAFQHSQGGRFFSRTFPARFFNSGSTSDTGDDGTVTTWLTPTLKSDSGSGTGGRVR